MNKQLMAIDALQMMLILYNYRFLSIFSGTAGIKVSPVGLQVSWVSSITAGLQVSWDLLWDCKYLWISSRLAGIWRSPLGLQQPVEWPQARGAGVVDSRSRYQPVVCRLTVCLRVHRALCRFPPRLIGTMVRREARNRMEDNHN
ncbi:hypothetical protein RRG08_053056 [Elysia crispata]|uniref:Uncharacterized protein n=1 Tax=Elysia crispata TaxID=231223 RepID=A0AAE0XSM0_9GAST|nr:hypothetical protein RRG08_053056 [Elysia crispata]